jgi:hypothetical protein
MRFCCKIRKPVLEKRDVKNHNYEVINSWCEFREDETIIGGDVPAAWGPTAKFYVSLGECWFEIRHFSPAVVLFEDKMPQ